MLLSREVRQDKIASRGIEASINESALSATLQRSNPVQYTTHWIARLWTGGIEKPQVNDSLCVELEKHHHY